MRRLPIFCLLVMVTVLSACATLPTGPAVMSLPGTGKSFDQFRADDALCRQFAYEQVGGVTGQQAAQNSAVTSTIVGTALGAAAGAAIGSASGQVGAGAAIGAASGLILGSAVGSGYASGAYYEAQQRYDNAYLQCMYAQGNRVPANGQFTRPASMTTARSATPRPAKYPPPPPPMPIPPPSPAPIDKLTLRINFDLDQAAIRLSDKAELDKAVAFVKKYPSAKIELDGYTDNIGTEAYNEKLSEKRAEAVKTYLMKEAGLDPSKISAVGRGQSSPVADNETKEGRLQNRRVEILILSE